MDKILPLMVSGAIGVVSAVLAILLNKFFETRSKRLATRREQLEKIFAPLEVLTRVNKQEFERIQKLGPDSHAEKEFIEQSIWYPNHTEIKRIIMTNSHLLPEIPQELLDLVDHINVWLFVYEKKYIKGDYSGPVYAGPRGKPYPKAADDYIFNTAARYRKKLNRRLF